ncbi:MAG: dihydrodipicolinate synthase family protein [Bacteroidales bacterium]
MSPEPKGVVVPMVSPFTEKGKIDADSAARLVDHVVSNGCHPFVLGTTGEAMSIPAQERIILLKATVRANQGRKTIYAGIAGMCFEESVEAGKRYVDEGAEVLVANLPSYYPLPAEHMLRYFTELADHLPGPLMIYNITSTTHMSIPVDVVRQLSRHENIIGLKDSERNADRLDTLVRFAKETPGFYYQLGWAAKSVYALKAGADGIVPSTANAFPRMYSELYDSSIDGDLEKAEFLQTATNELSAVYQKDKLLSQALPGLKVMLEELGLCHAHGVAPCYTPGQGERNRIVGEMRAVMERIPQWRNL